MTNMHAWKRRLWGPDYPIENGPPYLTSDGSPLFPGAIQGGPYEGVDDNGPVTGNPVVLTFTGPATGGLTVGVRIKDEIGIWTGANATVPDEATADEIGEAIADDFNARNWIGWIGAANVAGTVTFTPTGEGDATAYVLYAPAAGSAGTTINPPEPGLSPGGVDGPNTSANGVNYWISRSGGQGQQWYYWTDVDNTPGPDTKRHLGPFLADDAISQAYRNDVSARATALGY